MENSEKKHGSTLLAQISQEAAMPAISCLKRLSVIHTSPSQGANPVQGASIVCHLKKNGAHLFFRFASFFHQQNQHLHLSVSSELLLERKRVCGRERECVIMICLLMPPRYIHQITPLRTIPTMAFQNSQTRHTRFLEFCVILQHSS